MAKGKIQFPYARLEEPYGFPRWWIPPSWTAQKGVLHRTTGLAQLSFVMGGCTLNSMQPGRGLSIIEHSSMASREYSIIIPPAKPHLAMTPKSFHTYTSTNKFPPSPLRHLPKVILGYGWIDFVLPNRGVGPQFIGDFSSAVYYGAPPS